MPDENQTTPTMRLLIAFAGGFGAFLALLLIVLATGQTFGQRCERMYPADPIAQERCVGDLANGRR